MKSARSDDSGVAERNDGDGDECATQCDDGSEQIEWPVYGSGNDVFFKEGFRAVYQRLQQTEWANTVRPPAILNAAYKLALKQHGIGDGQQEHYRHHNHLEQAPQEKLQNRHACSASLANRQINPPLSLPARAPDAAVIL